MMRTRWFGVGLCGGFHRHCCTCNGLSEAREDWSFIRDIDVCMIHLESLGIVAVVRDIDVCMIHLESLGIVEVVRNIDVCMVHLDN